MRNRNVGFILIIIAAVLIEVTSFVQFWYAKEGIRNDVETHAISELRIKSLRIQNVMNETEVLVKSLADIVAHDLEKPEDMGDITRNILQNNPTIVGTAIAFEPYYYKEKGRQFSPYSYRDGDSIKTKQLGTEKYDYHNKEWYKVPFSKGEGHWSEPYFDEGGGEMVMSTYSFPVRDDSGKIVAVGEIGLDYYYTKDNKDKQQDLFRAQLDIAKKYNLPVIVHSREATKDTIDILKEYPDVHGVIHCFSGSLETALEYIKMGYYIGVGGVLTFKNSKLDDIIKELPVVRILFETDAPFLAPEPHRGHTNEPKYIKDIAEYASKLFDLSLDEISAIKESNVNTLFFKKKD